MLINNRKTVTNLIKRKLSYFPKITSSIEFSNKYNNVRYFFSANSTDSIEVQFEKVQELIKNSPNLNTPSKTMKLKIYALYKQATEGPISDDIKSPGVLDPVGRYKFNARKGLKDMSKVKAMEEYVKIIKDALENKNKSNDEKTQEHGFNQHVEEGKMYGGMPEDIFRYVAEILSPFARDFLSPKISHIGDGEITMVAKYRNEFIGNIMMPCLHGGIAASVMDHVGGFCAWTKITDRHYALNTVDLRVDYLKPGPCEDVVCIAKVVQDGRLIRVDMECWNKDQTVKFAIGRAVYNVYKLPLKQQSSDEDVNILYAEMRKDIKGFAEQFTKLN
jgi:uncharacterized protein (TIGR00369 family)